METKYLEHFISVYDHKSLTKSAQAMGVTQSSITKAIQKLEAGLNLPLFNRTTREVVPTAAATALYKYACRCISANKDFEDIASHLRQGERGVIRIGCGYLAHDLLIKPMLKQLAVENADIRLQVRSGSFEELKNGLDNHTYDCLFYDVGQLHHVHDPSDYEVVTLVKAPVHIVAPESHPIHLLSGDKQQAMFRYRWVVPPIPQRYLGVVPTPFREFLLSTNISIFEVADVAQALDLAEECNLITIAVGDMTHSNILRRKLKIIDSSLEIYSDIGFWRLRSRFRTPTIKYLTEVINKIVLINGVR